MQREDLLIVADSEHDANMRYVVGMAVPDPFIFMRIAGQDYIVMSDLEIDRARKQADHCRVLSLSEYQRKLELDNGKAKGFAHIIRLILKDLKAKRVTVPWEFPAGLADKLRNLKIKLKVRKGTFFEDRETKSAVEVKKISAALMMAEVGLAEGIQALKSSKIGRDGRLIYHHIPLTAEKLRSIMETAIVQAGGLASGTIVACGKQGCDPHERGYGPLKANRPIILDVFPRSQKTGYFGDITRTVVKGRASEAVREIYHTVKRGQDLAFHHLREGRTGREVHEAVRNLFDSEGYKTGKRKGRFVGFFHGTGHGLGLEIHEAPRIGTTSKDVLKSGHVVTVEPGLYYPEIGGVRLEDVALVTAQSPRNLTKFEKVLEL